MIRKEADEMTKCKHEYDYDDTHDELNKWDVILTNIFVISLLVGLLITGFVLTGMTN